MSKKCTCEEGEYCDLDSSPLVEVEPDSSPAVNLDGPAKGDRYSGAPGVGL